MKKILNGFSTISYVHEHVPMATNLVNAKIKKISQHQTQHITSKVKITSLYDLHVIPSRH